MTEQLKARISLFLVELNALCEKHHLILVANSGEGEPDIFEIVDVVGDLVPVAMVWRDWGDDGAIPPLQWSDQP